MILVWKSYGDIKIYPAEEPEDLIKIIDTVIACIDGWGLETTIMLCKSHMNKVGLDRKELRKVLNTLIDEINPSYDNDSFEDFFLTELSNL